MENELKNIVNQFTCHAYQISTHEFTGTLATAEEAFRSEDVKKTVSEARPDKPNSL